ncbi:MAG: hypothetical protein OK455_05130 [Thaumarchaeota archaeon]|nr:hypothetical protein [Nitrososphaerota archaeon]
MGSEGMSSSHRGRVPHTSPRYRSRLRPLGDADFGRIVKKAARNAGMKELPA